MSNQVKLKYLEERIERLASRIASAENNCNFGLSDELSEELEVVISAKNMLIAEMKQEAVAK